jgi:hypothetical protein
VEPPQITPEPEEAEREAILAALAEEGAERPAADRWTEVLLPSRDGQDDEP